MAEVYVDGVLWDDIIHGIKGDMKYE